MRMTRSAMLEVLREDYIAPPAPRGWSAPDHQPPWR